MKKEVFLMLLVFSILLCNRSNAQTKRMLLFDKYNDGTVLMKNRSKTSAKLNYDTANKKMMYLQNNQEMILMNNAQIDTIFISDRKFISLNAIYLEVIEMRNSDIFIDWTLKEKYKGNKGAYGQITQNKVESINTSFWTNDEYKMQSTAVFERENANTYWFYLDEKPIKCKSVKDLNKIFANKKNKISTFIKENKINFKTAKDAVKLIDFCLQ